jgi:hypothetical protein
LLKKSKVTLPVGGVPGGKPVTVAVQIGISPNVIVVELGDRAVILEPSKTMALAGVRSPKLITAAHVMLLNCV